MMVRPVGSAAIRPLEIERPAPLAEPEESDFSAQMLDLVEEVSDVADEADAAGEGLISGRVELHQAMMTMEKANIALKVGTTVRNKVLDAYRQLSQVSG